MNDEIWKLEKEMLELRIKCLRAKARSDHFNRVLDAGIKIIVDQMNAPVVALISDLRKL